MAEEFGETQSGNSVLAPASGRLGHLLDACHPYGISDRNQNCFPAASAKVAVEPTVAPGSPTLSQHPSAPTAPLQQSQRPPSASGQLFSTTGSWEPHPESTWNLASIQIQSSPGHMHLTSGKFWRTRNNKARVTWVKDPTPHAKCYYYRNFTRQRTLQ